MSETIKEGFNSVMLSVSEKFTFEVKRGLWEIPPIPRGNQIEDDRFAVGALVETAETSTRKPGIRGRIIRAYEEHGYWYYDVDGIGIQRQQDIRRVQHDS